MSTERQTAMTDDELVELVGSCENWGNKPFTTAPELGEKIDMSRWGVQKRLNALAETGRIEKYNAGQAAIYWRED